MNLLHYYIEKQNDDMLPVIYDAITHLQKKYFQSGLNRLTTSLIEQEIPYFLDNALADFFDDVCKNLEIKEYYFMDKPPRFILQNGEIQSLFIVLEEKNLEEHISILKDEDAPKEWIEKINSKELIPYFETEDGFYMPESPSSCNHLLKPTIINGQKDYYCAIIENHHSNKSSLLYTIETSSQLH